jgi:hypothetical protein
VRARVPAKGGDAYGKHREHHSGPALATVTVLTDADVDRPGTLPPGRLVAYWGTRTRADHARRIRRLERVLRECRGSECFARAAAVDPGSAAGVYVATG